MAGRRTIRLFVFRSRSTNGQNSKRDRGSVPPTPQISSPIPIAYVCYKYAVVMAYLWQEFPFFIFLYYFSVANCSTDNIFSTQHNINVGFKYTTVAKMLANIELAHQCHYDTSATSLICRLLRPSTSASTWGGVHRCTQLFCIPLSVNALCTLMHYRAFSADILYVQSNPSFNQFEKKNLFEIKKLFFQEWPGQEGSIKHSFDNKDTK